MGFLLLLPVVGCSYTGARFRDFGDIFRLEANVGLGLQAHANAGELVHTGVGSSGHHAIGWSYGQFDSQWNREDHIPLSLIYTFFNPEAQSLHSLELEQEDGKMAKHRCYVIFPGELHEGNLRKSDIHYFDIEVGALALVVGLEVGFSIGEFFDFLLGLFTIDIADDDDPQERDRRTLWIWKERRKALTTP